MDERFKKIEEALTSNEFAEKMGACDSQEELKELFSSIDVQLSNEELDAFVDSVRKQMTVSGEFTEKDLDAVSGGFGPIALGLVIIGGFAAGRLYGSYVKKTLGKLFR